MAPICSREVTFPWHGSTHCCLHDVRLGSLLTSFLHAGMCAKEAVLWGTWWSFGVPDGLLGCKARECCSAPKSLINLIDLILFSFFFFPMSSFLFCSLGCGWNPTELPAEERESWGERGWGGLGWRKGSLILILVLISEPVGLAAEPSFGRRGTRWEQKYRDLARSSPTVAREGPIGPSYMLTAVL